MSYQRNYVQNLINGFMSTMVLYTSCELGIFDALKKESQSVSKLAEALQITEIELIRLLRPLEQYKLLQIKGNEWMLSELGEWLTTDQEGSLNAYTLFCGRESLPAWSCMSPALKKQVSPGEVWNQSNIFSDMEQNGARFQTFNGMMSSVSKQLDLTAFFEEFINKNETFTIADVGGGTGTIIKKFLNYYTNATGTILDLPQAKKDALRNLEKSNMTNRCSFMETDFFQAIQVHADVYVLSRVLHDWMDPQAIQILQNVAREMEDNSKLVIIEEVIREPDEPNAMRSYMNDIQMWVFCDGKERTLQEFTDLFLQAGLKLDRLFDTEEGTAVLVAVKDNEEVGEI